MVRSRKASLRDPEVFDYLDYRAFLLDLYNGRKGQDRPFSYRQFSKRAGLKSTNYLKLVMDGERNLTAAMADRFAEALGLEDDARVYFSDLVQFNQAKTNKERNTHYQRLTNSRKYKASHQIDVAQAAYHGAWYMPAIREMVARSDFRDDPSWIARMLVPTISKREAEKALKTLFLLKMIRRDDDGRIVQQDSLISTGAEVIGVHIGNYHREMMGRAAESIDLLGPAERDISSLTLCLGEDGVRRLKRRLQRFRQELLEMTALEDDPRQVLQVNLQLFPLCREDDVDQEAEK